MNAVKVLTTSFIMLLTLGGLGAYYILPYTNDAQKKAIKNTPNITIDHLNFTAFNKQGHIEKKLESDTLYHYDKENSHHLDKITLYVFKDQDSPWQITANHAKSIDNNNKIILSGNVILQQAASENNKKRVVHTETLTYYPKIAYAFTNEKVTMQQVGTHLSSIGMKVYLDKQQIELLESARVHYEVPNA